MLKSENEGYGFYGTMSLDGCADNAWAAAMARWQSWSLGRRTRRELGIPTPMRYLDGMVYAAAAYAEAI